MRSATLRKCEGSRRKFTPQFIPVHRNVRKNVKNEREMGKMLAR